MVESSELEQRNVRRQARREETRRDVAEIRRRLAELGHPLPDDATEEEMIETINIVARLIGPGGIFSPGTRMPPSD